MKHVGTYLKGIKQMSQIQVKNTAPPIALDPAVIESLVINGDLSKLKPEQKVMYYNYRCQQAGLDPAAKPFDLLRLNGKEVLYANASATQQLCAIHGLSTQITHREKVDDIYLVSTRCTGKDGRVSENQGAVSIGSLKGDVLANAILKATTKAIRRTVLAHCGLGMLDETETEAIPQAQRVELQLQNPTTKPAVSLEDMESDDFELNPAPEGAWKLWVPNMEQPYAVYPTYEEFKAGMFELCDKIINNRKLDDVEKHKKLRELATANEQNTSGLSSHERIQFTAKFATVRSAEDTKKHEATQNG
jgi:hypothetical protein